MRGEDGMEITVQNGKRPGGVGEGKASASQKEEWVWQWGTGLFEPVIADEKNSVRSLRLPAVF
jgi:hypothetical protein